MSERKSVCASASQSAGERTLSINESAGTREREKIKRVRERERERERVEERVINKRRASATQARTYVPTHVGTSPL